MARMPKSSMAMNVAPGSPGGGMKKPTQIPKATKKGGIRTPYTQNIVGKR